MFTLRDTVTGDTILKYAVKSNLPIFLNYKITAPLSMVYATSWGLSTTSAATAKFIFTFFGWVEDS